MSVELVTCFKCWADTAQLTYEENRLYKVSCSCGYEYTFNHCSLNDALLYHCKMLELYEEIDKNEAANTKIAELQEKYDRLNDFDNTQSAKLLAKVAELTAEVEGLKGQIGSIHKTLDFADSCRFKAKDYAELGVSNGLALGQIAVTIGHDYKTREAAEKAIAEKGGQK